MFAIEKNGRSKGHLKFSKRTERFKQATKTKTSYGQRVNSKRLKESLQT